MQHPLEVDNAKGSARLLHLCLSNSRMVSGEVFPEVALQGLLKAPFESDAFDQTPKHAVLLYPDSPQNAGLQWLEPPNLPPEWLDDPSQLRLVVLDGTWRKSRKMLHLNPLLQKLPRLSLIGLTESHYLIRKAHRPDQRSTLEATCAALARMEGRSEPFLPLLEAFDGFVAQQLEARLLGNGDGVLPPDVREVA